MSDPNPTQRSESELPARTGPSSPPSITTVACHVPTPHWLSTPPPPQVSGSAQAPQERNPPQPSGGCPHAPANWEHWKGTHGLHLPPSQPKAQAWSVSGYSHWPLVQPPGENVLSTFGETHSGLEI